MTSGEREQQGRTDAPRYRVRVRFQIRRATAADQNVLRRALHCAWRWSEPWSEQEFQEQLARNAPDPYVDDFGRRPGDVGFVGRIASGRSRQWSGAAWCRWFTADHHRSGYLAPDVPELVVGVVEDGRGQGLGSALMRRLLQEADVRGLPAVGLHVARENRRAQHLYDALGFVVAVDRGDRGLVMRRELRRRPSS